MKEAKISEIKNRLSRYLAFVRRGEVVRILDRDVPIAQIVPIDATSPGGEALAEMERKGLIRRGTGKIPRELLDRDPPGAPVGALRALLEERESR
jgi:prevent-host-death family protein